MDEKIENPPPHRIRLCEGGQAVINGALVTAVVPCELQVGAGSFVVTGSSLEPSQAALRNPREELYFSMLDASTNEDRFADARFRLFSLLAQVVAQDRTYQGQRECAACAAALIAGNVEDAVRCAARLASDRFGEGPRGSRFEDRKTKSLRNRFLAEDLRV